MINTKLLDIYKFLFKISQMSIAAALASFVIYLQIMVNVDLKAHDLRYKLEQAHQKEHTLITCDIKSEHYALCKSSEHTMDVLNISGTLSEYVYKFFFVSGFFTFIAGSIAFLKYKPKDEE